MMKSCIHQSLSRRPRGAYIPATVVMLATVLLAASAQAEPSGIDIGRFIERASIRHETTFELKTSLERWNRMLDDPVLMGRLWDLFECKPPYRVGIAGAAIHIIDPTGLTGTVRAIEQTPGRRLYLADGKIKNWFMPVSLTGQAIITLEHEPAPGGIRIGLGLYGEEGNNRATRLLLKAIGPILSRFIARRAAWNIEDLSGIVTGIENDPAGIRERLPDVWRGSFDRVTAPLTGTPHVAPIFPFGYTGDAGTVKEPD